MRVLSQDLTFSPDSIWFNLLRIGQIPPTYAGSDLWFRVMDAEQLGTTEVWCFLTREEATAATPPDTWIAHVIFAQVEAQTLEIEAPLKHGATPLLLVLQSYKGLQEPGQVWSSIYTRNA